MCVCVCVRVLVCVCVYMCVYALCVYMCVCMHCVYIYVCVCIVYKYVCTHVYVCHFRHAHTETLLIILTYHAMYIHHFIIINTKHIHAL